MSPGRLLVVLLFAFVILSGLNYFYYYERTEALNAQSHELTNSVVTNPLGVIVTSENILHESRREFHGMVIREVVLVVLALVGMVSLARRK